MKVTIVSSDKDFLQLVTEDISVFDPFNMARLGPNEVFEKYGVRTLIRPSIACRFRSLGRCYRHFTCPPSSIPPTQPTDQPHNPTHTTHYTITLQLEPYQLLDYFAMVGDTADNVRATACAFFLGGFGVGAAVWAFWSSVVLVLWSNEP